MKVTAVASLSFLLFVTTSGHPLFPKNPTKYDNAEELAGKFEGDMDLTPEQMTAISRPNQRNGLINVTKRWPNNYVNYVISGNYTHEQKIYIMKAIDMIELVTCIKFAYHYFSYGLNDYIDVVSTGSGCSSQVGYVGGRQTLNLQDNPIGEGCFRLATIMHEFIHALGFYHMQSSHDRDDFVTVMWNNITPGKEHNFNKYDSKTVTDFGIEYDYNSVMHYSTNGFSKNGKATIIPKDPNASIGQRITMSRRDIEKLNRMYNCPL